MIKKCFNCGVSVTLKKDQVELEKEMRKVNPDFELLVWCENCGKKPKKKKPDIVNFLYDILTIFIALGILVLIINIGEKSPNLFSKVISNLNSLSYITLNIGAGFLSSLLFVVLLENYYPRGHAIDNSHIWVINDIKEKYRDATKRDVYEHYHGYGSWGKKSKAEWNIIRIIGFVFAGCGGFFVAFLKEKIHSAFVVLISAIIGILIYILIQKLLNIEFITQDSSTNSFQTINMDFSNLFKGEASRSMLYYGIAFFIVFIFSIIISVYWIIYFFILHNDSTTLLNPPSIHSYTITLRLMGIFVLFLLGEWLFLKQKERKAKR